jgi:hypothetical protein
MRLEMRLAGSRLTSQEEGKSCGGENKISDSVLTVCVFVTVVGVIVPLTLMGWTYSPLNSI